MPYSFRQIRASADHWLASSPGRTCSACAGLLGPRTPVYDLSASCEHRAQLTPVDTLGRPRARMPGQPCDFLDRHTLVTHHADERRPQFLRHPPSTQPRSRGYPPEIPPQVMRLIRCPYRSSEHQSMLLPQLPGLGPLPSLPLPLPPHRFYSDFRQLQRPPRPVRLRVSVCTHRPPYRDRPRLQVHV